MTFRVGKSIFRALKMTFLLRKSIFEPFSSFPVEENRIRIIQAISPKENRLMYPFHSHFLSNDLSRGSLLCDGNNDYG